MCFHTAVVKNTLETDFGRFKIILPITLLFEIGILHLSEILLEVLFVSLDPGCVEHCVFNVLFDCPFSRVEILGEEFFDFFCFFFCGETAGGEGNESLKE